MYLATRIDDFMASRREKEPKDLGLLFLFYGLLSLVAGLWNIHRREFDGFSVVLFMSATLALCIGIKNLWIYLRQRSGEYHPAYVKPVNPGELTVLKLGGPVKPIVADRPVGGIPTAESGVTAPPSVTEPTTKSLQAPLDNRTGPSPSH
jgi:hypothetical protein